MTEDSSTSTTRYLCAAAHLDINFATWVITEVYKSQYKFVAPSHGVDMVAVLKHCLLARRRRLRRNLGLAALVVVNLLTWPLIVLAPSVGFSLASILFWLGFPAFLAIMFAERWAGYSVIRRTLLPMNFNPHAVNVTLSPRLRSLLDALAVEERGNVIVYSGYSPFVGSGINVGAWSFPVDATRGKRDLGVAREPKPFELPELLEHVTAAVRRLGYPSLTVEDNLYVNGKYVRSDQRFLEHPQARPRRRVGESLVYELMRQRETAARHYRTFRISDWYGELVVSVFLRFSLIGPTLFCEASQYLLTPLKEGYRRIDEYQPEPELELSRVVGMVTGVLGTAIKWWLFWWFLAPRDALRTYRRGAELRSLASQVRRNPMFDFGAETSLREQAGSPAYQYYFQRLDKEMYAKTIESCILDATIEFLDEHDIDTSDLKERQTTILNSGVIVTGGTVQADSMAVGQQAVSATIGGRVASAAQRFTGAGQQPGSPAPAQHA